jgi:hypothetical protein
VIYLNPIKGSQQREVTMPKENKNRNEKRTTEMNLMGKKARKLRKNKVKIEKLQQVLEGTSQKETLQNWSFARILEQRHMTVHYGEAM